MSSTDSLQRLLFAYEGYSSELESCPFGKEEDRRLGTYALGHKVAELRGWLIHNLSDGARRKHLHYAFSKIKSVSPDFAESLKVMAETGILQSMVDKEELPYDLDLLSKKFEGVWVKIAKSITPDRWAEVADAGVGFPSQNALMLSFPMTTGLAQKFWKFYASRQSSFSEIYDNQGNTLLQSAAAVLVIADKLRQGVKWFSSMGGDLLSKNIEGNNICHTLAYTDLSLVNAVISENAAEAISFLATKSDINERNFHGDSLFLLASARGAQTLCAFLVENTNAKTIVSNHKGEDPLFLIDNLSTTNTCIRSQTNVSWGAIEVVKIKMRDLVMKTNERQLREAANSCPVFSGFVRKI